MGGAFGQTLTKAAPRFSPSPYDGYTVTVERWTAAAFTPSPGRSWRELEGFPGPDTAPTTRCGRICGDALYDMEFYFYIGQEADKEVWQTG